MKYLLILFLLTGCYGGDIELLQAKARYQEDEIEKLKDTLLYQEQVREYEKLCEWYSKTKGATKYFVSRYDHNGLKYQGLEAECTFDWDTSKRGRLLLSSIKILKDNCNCNK